MPKLNFKGVGFVRNRLPKYLAERGMTRERYMALMWTCRGYDEMRRRLAQMGVGLATEIPPL